MGHILSEIGCIWKSSSPEEVLEQAQEETVKFYSWLERHGEKVPDFAGEEFIFVPGEWQEIADFGISGAAVGFFEADRIPVTDAELALAVKRLGYARADLLELVAVLPESVLDWEPGGGRRTVRDNLIHVRNCYPWYLSRVLGIDTAKKLIPKPFPEDTIESLTYVKNCAVEALLAFPRELREGTFQAEKPTEQWTARKMLRRFVEHEREHLAIVRRTVGEWEQWRNGNRSGSD